MKLKIYEAREYELTDEQILALEKKARRRRKHNCGKGVRVEGIIEEARREGLIQIGPDYSVDGDGPTIFQNGKCVY